jgi:hypothetical protein
VLWAAVVQGRAAVPDVAALDAVQQVDPGLPDAVNRRQVAVLQAMAAELGAQPDMVPEAAFAVPSSVLLRALLEWVANHSGVDEAVIRAWLRDGTEPENTANDATTTDCCPLGDVNPNLLFTRQQRIVHRVLARLLSLQLTSDGLSSQCAPDRPSSARWNDCETARWFGDDPGRDRWQRA